MNEERMGKATNVEKQDPKQLGELKGLPADPSIVAEDIIRSTKEILKMSPAEEEKVKALIRDAVGERMGLMDDVRIGRVLGSALATL